MKAENFCFWLQGFFELNHGTTDITPRQAAQIKTHLALVFKHDPTMAHEPPVKGVEAIDNTARVRSFPYDGTLFC